MRITPLDVILSQDSFLEIQQYLDVIRENPDRMGNRLKYVLFNCNLATLTIVQFVDALLKTKKPLIFAEDMAQLHADGSDWTEREIQIMGQIGIKIENVDVYTKQTWNPQPQDRMTAEHRINALITNGPLLNGHGCDRSEVLTHDGYLDRQKLLNYFEKRLLPLLILASQQEKNNEMGAVVVLPSLGAGAFSGDCKFADGKRLHQKIGEIYRELLYRHIAELSGIKGVVHDTFNGHCRSYNIGHIKYIEEACALRVGPGQLALAEEHDPSFMDAAIYNVVAGDHLSFPGNDLYENHATTHEGGLSARTNLMTLITGVPGELRNHIYLPEQGRWVDICESRQIQLGVASLRVFQNRAEEIIEYSPSDDYNPRYLSALRPATIFDFQNVADDARDTSVIRSKFISHPTCAVDILLALSDLLEDSIGNIHVLEERFENFDPVTQTSSGPLSAIYVKFLITEIEAFSTLRDRLQAMENNLILEINQAIDGSLYMALDPAVLVVEQTTQVVYEREPDLRQNVMSSPRLSIFEMRRVPTVDMNVLNDSVQLNTFCVQFADAYAEASVDPNLTGNDSMILGDIGRALLYLNRRLEAFRTMAIPSAFVNSRSAATNFIAKHFSILQVASMDLNQSDDPGARASAETLLQLYNQLTPNDQPEVIAERRAHTSVILAHIARNGELVFRFQNRSARDQFFYETLQGQQGVIPQQFRTGVQFESNPAGNTPVLYDDQPCAIVFPTYQALNREIGVNCGSENVRRLLLNGLGLSPASELRGVADSQRYLDTDGHLICTAYGGRQKMALYFERTHQLLQQGGYIRFERNSQADMTIITTGVLPSNDLQILAQQDREEVVDDNTVVFR